MSDEQNDGAWRDEDKLPVSELGQAMASWDTDGQGDPTDGDAGAEQAFGHGPPADSGDAGSTDAEQLRPSTTGRTGPH
jgi:hypothetical protein